MREEFETIRRELVIPFIKESEQAKTYLRVDEHDRLWETNDNNDLNRFPNGKGKDDHELVQLQDIFYGCAMDNLEFITSRFEETRSLKKKLNDYEESSDRRWLFVSNRMRCDEYLLSIARGPYAAEKKYYTENPLTLYVAVYSLEWLMHGTIRDEIRNAVRELVMERLDGLDKQEEAEATCG